MKINPEKAKVMVGGLKRKITNRKVDPNAKWGKKMTKIRYYARNVVNG